MGKIYVQIVTSSLCDTYVVAPALKVIGCNRGCNNVRTCKLYMTFRFFKKGSCQLLAKVCARSTG